MVLGCGEYMLGYNAGVGIGKGGIGSVREELKGTYPSWSAFSLSFTDSY